MPNFSARPFTLSAACLALFAYGCGDNVTNNVAADEPENAAGAAAVETFPPALGPQDCATSTSKVTLSQPAAAAVWGGLVVLEFKVAGPKVASFDVQFYDPATEAWLSNNVGVSYSAQRDDGTYVLAASPTLNDVNKDSELKLRIRPSQQGCPQADWTETETFTQANPLSQTSWQADVQGAFINNSLNVQRTPKDSEMSLPSAPLHVANAALALSFSKKGVFSEVVTIDLESETAAPYDGCTLNLTYTGTWDISLRQQYGDLTLVISEQQLSSIEGTTCDFPTLGEMALSADDFKLTIPASTQSINIGYQPTLYTTPGAPEWFGSNFTRVFEQLGQYLAYETDTETGNVNGYIYTQDVIFNQQ
jgi:hypothetical protein